jgi:hypothetical protein
VSRAVEETNRRMLRARDAMDRAYSGPLDQGLTLAEDLVTQLDPVDADDLGRTCGHQNHCPKCGMPVLSAFTSAESSDCAKRLKQVFNLEAEPRGRIG